MSVCVEKTGKTVDDAQKAALEELGVSEDLVVFEILEEPKKGFFGFGGKPAKVRATVRELTPVDKAKKFLSEIFAAMGIEVSLNVHEEENGHVFDLIGENLGILIGKHGQTLDSLQYLSNLAANSGLLEGKVRIILDIENYRLRREETLRRLAERLAERVRNTGERIVLEPMNRHERKIIHMALQDNYKIYTYSSGDEPCRKVVIEPRRSRSGRGGRYSRGGYESRNSYGSRPPRNKEFSTDYADDDSFAETPLESSSEKTVG